MVVWRPVAVVVSWPRACLGAVGRCFCLLFFACFCSLLLRFLVVYLSCWLGGGGCSPFGWFFCLFVLFGGVSCVCSFCACSFFCFFFRVVASWLLFCGLWWRLACAVLVCSFACWRGSCCGSCSCCAGCVLFWFSSFLVVSCVCCAGCVRPLPRVLVVVCFSVACSVCCAWFLVPCSCLASRPFLCGLFSCLSGGCVFFCPCGCCLAWFFCVWLLPFPCGGCCRFLFSFGAWCRCAFFLLRWCVLPCPCCRVPFSCALPPLVVVSLRLFGCLLPSCPPSLAGPSCLRFASPRVIGGGKTERRNPRVPYAGRWG